MTTYAQPTYPVSSSNEGLVGKWTDIFRSDVLVHVGIMGSIIAGTFQAYLKDRIAGPIPYALSDGAFILAVAAWFGSLAIRRDPIRGPGATPIFILAIILVPAFYLLHPGAPLLVRVAGLRGWSMFPVAGLMALTVIRNAAQLRAYIGLVLILCTITAIYGIMQYAAGPEVVAAVGNLAIERHGSSIYYSIGNSGQTGFRAYSTFTFPAPFASMMGFGILLASGIALSKNRAIPIRWLMAALIPLFFMGITVSGTRATLINVMLGLLVLAWFRRITMAQLLLIPVALVAFYFGSIVTAGRILARYQTLLVQEGLLWTYLAAPVVTAARYLSSDPLGLGLGRTGIGVPFAITSAMPADYFVFTDGDIGRAAVELGIIGVVLLAVVVFGLIRYIPLAARTLIGTSSEDVSLGVAPLVIAAAVFLLIGSPFSSVPHGIIWWFFFGALLKLAMDRQASLLQPATAPTAPPGDT